MPNNVYEATPTSALYQVITKEIYCIPFIHREEDPHITLVPTKGTFIGLFSPTRQHDAIAHCTANHAPAGEGK